MIRRYHAYLLRLWHEGADERRNWRAQLTDPHTHQQIGFANLEALFAHLRQLAESDPNAPSAPRPPPETTPDPSAQNPTPPEQDHH